MRTERYKFNLKSNVTITTNSDKRAIELMRILDKRVVYQNGELKTR